MPRVADVIPVGTRIRINDQCIYEPIRGSEREIVRTFYPDHSKASMPKDMALAFYWIEFNTLPHALYRHEFEVI